jgi:TetR/AcrR family transcriptional regulator
MSSKLPPRESATNSAASSRERGSITDDEGLSAPAGRGSANQSRILEVATAEFAEKGFAGGRVAEIAARAEVNKQLLYYYFGSKEGLYSAVLGGTVAVSRRLIDVIAQSGSLTTAWVSALTPASIARRRKMRRLWLWEALDHRDAEILREQERRVEWERLIEMVSHEMRAGQIDAELDPAMALLAVDSILNTPYMLPQVTRLIAGLDPDDPVFTNRLRDFVRQFLAALAPAERRGR